MVSEREREEGEEHAYRVLQVAHSLKITLRAIDTFPHRLISNVRSFPVLCPAFIVRAKVTSVNCCFMHGRSLC